MQEFMKAAREIGFSKYSTRRVKPGIYVITHDGVDVGYIVKRSRDWYGEMVLHGLIVSECGPSKLDVEMDLPAAFWRLVNKFSAVTRDAAQNPFTIAGFVETFDQYRNAA